MATCKYGWIHGDGTDRCNCADPRPPKTHKVTFIPVKPMSVEVVADSIEKAKQYAAEDWWQLDAPLDLINGKVVQFDVEVLETGEHFISYGY